jgi:hypothetical protein
MPLDSSELEWAVRLSAQLKTLSEVTESLTYRMLELEERFAGQQRQLTSRQRVLEQRHTDLAEVIEQRMRDTENRLGRLEELLRHGERRAVPPAPLRAVPQPGALAPQGRLSTSDGLNTDKARDSFLPQDGLDEEVPGGPGRCDPPLAS